MADKVLRRSPSWSTVVALVALGWSCLNPLSSWASERGEIFRQSRSGTVLLVSVNKATRSLSFGTGFFISQQGHILTNAHVVAPEEKLLVYVPHMGVFPDARMVAIDQDADLAVLHLPEVQGRALALATGSAEEGTDALAVGFPRVIDTLQMGLTLHSTVKPLNVSGVVMGRSRTAGRIIPFIQASGVLHAGTSGGPIVDAARGQVLGVVVHSVPYMGQATDHQGSLIGSVMLRADMSYAIPASFIRQWLKDHDISYELNVPDHKKSSAFEAFRRVQDDPRLLGMSLFLTGHLVQTIADTVNVDPAFVELAVNHYEKALEIFPEQTVIARNLALLYASLDRFEEAMKIYEGLLQVSPSDLLLLVESAQTLKALHRDEKAIAMYRTVLNQESCSLDALNGLGNLYLSNQDYELAVQTFRQAVTCAPSSAYASFYLGESMTRSGLVEEAQAVWKGTLDRITIHTPQEQELFDLIRERTVQSRALLSHAASVKESVLSHNPVSH